MEQEYKKIIVDLESKINNKAYMPLIAAIIRVAIERNFDEGGRWNGKSFDLFSGGSQKWTPLAESTKKSYKRLGYLLEPTLYRSGYLRNTIEVTNAGDKIIIRAGAPYARIHQLGGFAGRGHKSKIPPRPYLTITNDELNDIVEAVSKILGV